VCSQENRIEISSDSHSWIGSSDVVVVVVVVVVIVVR
jgi:hypothetical protein